MLESVGGLETEEEGEEARVTCHLMIIHYPQGSEVTSGEEEVVRD